MAFRGVILCGVRSFLSPRIGLNFRHLSSCDTIEINERILWNRVFVGSTDQESSQQLRTWLPEHFFVP